MIKQVVLVLGLLGALVGVIMMIMGIRAKGEINIDLIIYGFLTAIVSAVITFIARIVILQRN